MDKRRRESLVASAHGRNKHLGSWNGRNKTESNWFKMNQTSSDCTTLAFHFVRVVFYGRMDCRVGGLHISKQSTYDSSVVNDKYIRCIGAWFVPLCCVDSCATCLFYTIRIRRSRPFEPLLYCREHTISYRFLVPCWLLRDTCALYYSHPAFPSVWFLIIL